MACRKKRQHIAITISNKVISSGKGVNKFDERKKQDVPASRLTKGIILPLSALLCHEALFLSRKEPFCGFRK